MGNLEPVRNVFKKGGSGGDDMDFELPPKGVSIYGLIKIKNITIENDYGKKEGYRLVFRNRDNPHCFVCYDQSAVLSDRSNLGKALIRMTSGAFDKYEELEPGEAFRLFMECLDKWFKIMVKHTAGTKNPSIIYARVSDNDINLHEMPGDLPVEYFKNHKPASRPVEAQKPVETGFEGYGDGTLTPEKKEAPKASSAIERAKADTVDEDDIPF